MTEWSDPSAWANAAKALATTLAALNKIRDRLSRGRSRTNGKKATEHSSVHGLTTQAGVTKQDLQEVIDLIVKLMDSLRRVYESSADKAEKNLSLIEKWGEVTTGVQKVLAIHEQRLRAVEGHRRPPRRRPKGK